jgi:hypothetical protein
MSATPNDFIPESGVRNWRIEYIRETNRGQTPDSPEWNIYSDHVENWWDWEPEANKNANQPAGDVDPDFTKPGSETHEATIAYWLQEWFVDASGNAQDASADAMLVSSDNTVNNTHSIVSRMGVNQNGNDGAGYRVYHVAKGGVPTEVTIPFEVDEGNPVMPELSYQFEQFRTYTIHQPSADTTLEISNNGSSEIDVTVEDEGASTAETLTVSGGSTGTTTATFGDIDVVELSDDVDGDVVVTDGSGTTFATIQGSDDRTTEGDLGVPALGSGSHASAIGTDYVIFNDDQPPQWGGSELDAEWISGELSVSLEVEDNEVGGTSKRNIHITGRRTTWSNTIAGPDASVAQVERFLSAEANDIVWTADEGSVTGPNAEYFSPGSSDFEAGSGKNQRDIELQSQGVNIS